MSCPVMLPFSLFLDVFNCRRHGQAAVTKVADKTTLPIRIWYLVPVALVDDLSVSAVSDVPITLFFLITFKEVATAGKRRRTICSAFLWQRLTYPALVQV